MLERYGSLGNGEFNCIYRLQLGIFYLNPGMEQEYLLLCSVKIGSGYPPPPLRDFFYIVYKGHCRPGVKLLLRRSKAAPSLPSTHFLNQV
jgi:hypothetical protein